MDILLVDDNPDYLDIVTDALKLGGYSVHSASDGAQGAELLESTDIDLIISDIRMPRLDGIKLHAFARETDRYKTTKFVFLTGLKEYYSSSLTLNPAQDYLLDKTISLRELLRFIDGLLFGEHREAWV
jgi:DNA-binding response OmpR family regulator